MEIFYNLLKAILVIVVIFLLALLMRKREILTEDHSAVLARIVTDLCLPAIVFMTLAKQTIELSELEPAFVMLFTELFCIGIAWLVSLWPKKKSRANEMLAAGKPRSRGRTVGRFVRQRRATSCSMGTRRVRHTQSRGHMLPR